jgi:hypothetical protein
LGESFSTFFSRGGASSPSLSPSLSPPNLFPADLFLFGAGARFAFAFGAAAAAELLPLLQRWRLVPPTMLSLIWCSLGLLQNQLPK